MKTSKELRSTMNSGNRSKSGLKVNLSLKEDSIPLEQISEELEVAVKSSKTIVMQAKPRNVRDELVLHFFTCMLPYVTEIIYIISEKSNSNVPSSGASDIEIKDFKTISVKDLHRSDVLAVNGSNVSLKAKKKNTASSKAMSLEENLTVSDNCKDEKKSFHLPENQEDLYRTLSISSDPISLVPSLGFFDFSNREKILYEPITSNRPSLSRLEFEQNLLIKFKNGNVYEGTVTNKLMEGSGVFLWTDGTIYKGEFKQGTITGKGKITFTDLSWYNGDFCNGYREGQGVMSVTSTPLLYSGGWRAGKFHGEGWLLYNTNNWYEGEWKNGKKHGKGIRQYGTGGVYKGEWRNDMRNDQGSMLWHNNDYYRGSWVDNLMDGYGEYTWNSFHNTTMTYPIENTYEGIWRDGFRNGAGLMHFGLEGGVHLLGCWENNWKHGAGKLTCGNGKTIFLSPLFHNDKPIHLQSMCTLVTSADFEIPIFDIYISKTASKVSNMGKTSLKFNLDNFQLDNGSGKRLSKMNENFNPLEIPLQKMAEALDISYFIEIIFSRKSKSQESDFNCMLAQATLSFHPTSLDSEIKLHNVISDHVSSHTSYSKLETTKFMMAQYEDIKMKNVIIRLMPKLKELYNMYATITSTKKVDFKPILIRMYLWQLYIDIGIFEKGYSLVDTDLFFAAIPYNGAESQHGPFEKIHFWQFLLSLLAVGLEIYIDSSDNQSERNGLIAFSFTKFLENDVFPNAGRNLGWVLYDFRDLVPIESVYLLYRKLGMPHTARTFLRNSCVRKRHEPPAYLKTKETTPELIKNCKNFVLNCENIIYCKPEMKNVVPEVEEALKIPDMPFFNDPYRKELYVFRTLGPGKIVDCLAEVCPLMKKNGLLVNIDYPLTFIEFYNVLLLCVFTLIDKEYRKIEKLKRKEQREKELAELAAEVETVPSKLKSAKTKKGARKEHAT